MRMISSLGKPGTVSGEDPNFPEGPDFNPNSKSWMRLPQFLRE